MLGLSEVYGSSEEDEKGAGFLIEGETLHLSGEMEDLQSEPQVSGGADFRIR